MTAPAKKSKLIKGEKADWEVVVGMEVHAQVTSKAKLFSGAATEFGGAPNSHVSLVDAAMPGMLPVINEHCVAQAVRTGLGLKAKINLKSVFDRKNYFYPDLPQGYQISQYKSPIVGEGEVMVDLPEGGAGVATIKVGIERLHLEQDAGKSLHDQHPTMSYVDLNRSGVALMEIVTKPDLRSSQEAQAFLLKLYMILRYLGTSEAKMERGSLRADVNVSVRRPGEPLGTRCEIKNLNSISFIGNAIDYEARRQIEIIERGGSVVQETRLYDPNKRETRAMRSKEEAHDYRYFPDPDLLLLEFDQAYVDALASQLYELPDQMKERLMSQYGIAERVALTLLVEKSWAQFFEKVAGGRDAILSANWVINEVLARVNEDQIENEDSRALQLGAILDLISEGTISGKIAKELFDIVWNEGGDPRQIVEKRGMKQITDIAAIEKVVDEVISANSGKIAEVKYSPKIFQWLVGAVMKATDGKANPQAVNEVLKKKLGL